MATRDDAEVRRIVADVQEHAAGRDGRCEPADDLRPDVRRGMEDLRGDQVVRASHHA
jgi:hypothetical protein